MHGCTALVTSGKVQIGYPHKRNTTLVVIGKNNYWLPAHQLH